MSGRDEPERVSRKSSRSRASRQSREAKRRARRRGVPAELVRFAQVWERDGGICGLCGLQVDPGEVGQHNDAAGTFDHIIPLSHPDTRHTLDNVQLAHRSCNQRKADQVTEAQW